MERARRLRKIIRVGSSSLRGRLSDDDQPLWKQLLPRPSCPRVCPHPNPVNHGTRSSYYDPDRPSLPFPLFPALDPQFNLLISVLISLCRLFADFTRHNFYQLALKRGITNWGLLPLLERGYSPGGGHPGCCQCPLNLS